MKKLSCIAAVLAVLGLSRNLLANPDDKGFSQRAHSIVVVDHILGLTYSRESSELDYWIVSLGSTNHADKIFGARRLSVPRVGYHYFVGDSGVSVGFGLSYLNTSSSNDVEYSSASFAPRLGYATAFSSTTALWIRSGLTLSKAWNDDDSLTSTTWGSELQLVITPVSHFGILIGPMAEIGLSGAAHRGKAMMGSASETERVPRLFGLTFGVMADF